MLLTSLTIQHTVYILSLLTYTCFRTIRRYVAKSQGRRPHVGWHRSGRKRRFHKSGLVYTTVNYPQKTGFFKEQNGFLYANSQSDLTKTWFQKKAKSYLKHMLFIVPTRLSQNALKTFTITILFCSRLKVEPGVTSCL